MGTDTRYAQIVRLMDRIAYVNHDTDDAVRAGLLTEADLVAMGFKELLALFATLPAPSMAEMDGEFAARLLAQPNALASVIGHLTVNNPLMPGRWRCKAFQPVSAGRGQGYNSFAHLGRTVRRFPMQTLMAPSRYDGEPAYTLVYAAFRSMCGAIHMVDEVRRQVQALGHAVVSISREGGLGSGARARKDFPLLLFSQELLALLNSGVGIVEVFAQ